MEPTKMTKEEFKKFSLCSKCRYSSDFYPKNLNYCYWYSKILINFNKICYNCKTTNVHKCYLFEEKK